jgi:hypothetical protein
MDSALTGNTLLKFFCPTAKNWQHTAPKLKPMSQSEEFFSPKNWQRIL